MTSLHSYHSPAVSPLVALLEQLDEVLDHLTDEQYAKKPVGVIESSVGGHVRHCLDHVRSLLDAIWTGRLCYDNRNRGTEVETERDAAQQAIQDLIDVLDGLSGNFLDHELILSVLMDPTASPIHVRTSVGRELAYVLAHTIHHNALIGAMVTTLGAWLPDRFGYAPSTVRNMESTCVQ